MSRVVAFQHLFLEDVANFGEAVGVASSQSHDDETSSQPSLDCVGLKTSILQSHMATHAIRAFSNQDSRARLSSSYSE